MMTNTREPSWAFALAEQAGVTGVIGILAACLVPALAGARA